MNDFFRSSRLELTSSFPNRSIREMKAFRRVHSNPIRWFYFAELKFSWLLTRVWYTVYKNTPSLFACPNFALDEKLQLAERIDVSDWNISWQNNWVFCYRLVSSPERRIINVETIPWNPKHLRRTLFIYPAWCIHIELEKCIHITHKSVIGSKQFFRFNKK